MVKLIIFCILGAVGSAIALGLVMEDSACKNKATELEKTTRYSIESGCFIEIDDGVWIPEYTYTEKGE
jgi:hypothetical protein